LLPCVQSLPPTNPTRRWCGWRLLQLRRRSLLAGGLCPVADLVQQGDHLAWPVDNDVAAIEQMGRRFGGAHSNARVRDLEGAHVVEHRPVVLVIAEADDAAGVLTGQERSQ